MRERESADNQPVLGVYNYALYRRMRDRENPAVGVGVVHQALAAPHTTWGFLRFTVCLTDDCEVADERTPLAQ